MLLVLSTPGLGLWMFSHQVNMLFGVAWPGLATLPLNLGLLQWTATAVFPVVSAAQDSRQCSTSYIKKKKKRLYVKKAFLIIIIIT